MPKIASIISSTDIKRLQRTYDISVRCARTVLRKDAEARVIHADAPEAVLGLLKKWGMDLEQVPTYPQVLKQPTIALDHRKHILQECGVDVQVSSLAKYLRLNRTVVWALTVCGVLPDSLDLVGCLCDSAQIAGADRIRTELGNFARRQLMEVRLAVFKQLLKQKLECSDDAANVVVTRYPRNRHKSLRLTARVIDILQQHDFATEKLVSNRRQIVRNPYLLNTHPDQLEGLFQNCPSVINTDIRHLIQQVPRIAYVPWSNLSQITSILNEYGFKDEAVLKCAEVYSLSPNTIRERLELMAKVPQVWAMRHNPYFLRLLYSYQRTERRLEYLRSINMRCVGVHILMARLGDFRRFVSTGDDRSAGSDAAIYIARVLDMPKAAVRRKLSLHPFWRSVSVVTVSETLDALLKAGYTEEQCRCGLHLSLYPARRALAAAAAAAQEESVPARMRLQVALYLLEREGHFSGTAVFEAEPRSAIAAAAELEPL